MLRTTQELGPSHTIDLNGIATAVRTATWNYFDEGNHVVYSASGCATGTGPTYIYTLVNPVSITKRDADGVVLEQIEAASATTSGSLSAIIAAAGSGALAFPQSSYTKWTTTQYTDCCLAASQRVYRLIPTSGVGVSGTNYDETDYSYDPMKRLVRTASPGGTINWSVFDVQGQLTSTYIGTNDNGATFSDPTGGGASGNNMVLITTNVYDGGSAGGDGNLTQQAQQVDASTTRVSTMTYGKEKETQLIKLISRENIFILPVCVLAELVTTCSTEPWHGCRCLKNLRTTRRLNGYSSKLTPNFLCHFCATV